MRFSPLLIKKIPLLIQKLFRKSSKNYDLILGQLLIKQKVVTQDQIDSALKIQDENLIDLGKAVKLGHIIVEQGFASEDSILKAINENYQIEATTLDDDIYKLVKAKRGTFIERLPTPSIPIWLKLSFVMIMIVITTVVSISFVTLKRQKKQLYEQTVRIGMVSLNYFADNARIPLLDNNILQLNTLIKGVAGVDGLVYAAIVDKNNIVKAHSNLFEIGNLFMQLDKIKEVTDKGSITYFDYTHGSGLRMLNLTRSVIFKEKELGKVYVGVSIDFIEDMVQKERLTIVLTTLVVLLCSICISVLLGIGFSRPVSKLVLATQKIGEGDYKHKIMMKRKDELGNLALAFNQMSDDLMKKSLMQESFGKYVGTEVLEMILKNPESQWIKGYRNEASIVFSDIRGFMSSSAEKEPEDVVDGLNEYFEIVTKIVLDHGGYVDKFIGDAVLSVFGVPVYHKDHVKRASSAALEIQKQLLKISCESGNDLLSSVGIGIDTGVVISGNIGSQVKMEYTVIGDCVNVASRLNALACPGEVVISSNVFRKLSDMIIYDALLPQKIKGLKEKIEAFRLIRFKGNNA